MDQKNAKIWLITGISSGLGEALAQSVMENGDFVVGTFRKTDQVENFNQKHAGRALALKLDITQTKDIQNTFKTIQEKFGRLDVLVNNAGVGFAGAIEETDIEETRKVFETNFFGVLEMTRVFLPLFREQKSGHILQISSHSGIKGFPGFGIYSASKFALEGFSEALAQEIAPLGIKLTLVEPGPFRTNFASESLGMAQIVLADYQATAGVFRERIKGIHGKQEGDPQKAAQAIIRIVHSENPPLRLPLGKIALATISSKLESVQNDLNNYREIAEGAVF
ncbi:MAG: oxidoreductase [Microscillaceae bacterium]|nr:oxidoreductase [Microscillaceae bacterium]